MKSMKKSLALFTLLALCWVTTGMAAIEIKLGVVTGGPFDTFDPVARVINYPFLFKDSAQADEILDGPIGAEILKSLESSGFKGLCFRKTVSVTSPITKPRSKPPMTSRG